MKDECRFIYCKAGLLPPLPDVEYELRILQEDYKLGDFV